MNILEAFAVVKESVQTDIVCRNNWRDNIALAAMAEGVPQTVAVEVATRFLQCYFGPVK